MIHLESVDLDGDKSPACVFLDDKMHTLELSVGDNGDDVTCPRCRHILECEECG